MLWLALYFHHLPLDTFLRGADERPEEMPAAVYSTPGNQQWIHDCNRAATGLGIEPGMTLGAALTLCAALRTRARDEALEREALEGIAAWAGRFTSLVSLHPPRGVLLEIEGSLKLFGGVQALRHRVFHGARALGYQLRTAVAPTPLGAWLLCRAGTAQSVTNRLTLARVLRRLPIEVLERTDHLLQALHGMGLRTIGDCLRLPRDGAARRLGPEFLDYLDRVFGRVPDPRRPFVPPPRFDSRVLLPAEVEDAEALLFPTRRLLAELEGFLYARGAGVEAVRVSLMHPAQPATVLSIGLVRPRREARHLLDLLRERLERTALPAPVEALALHTDCLLPLGQRNRELFQDQADERRDWPQLVERLRAHLGHDAVHGIMPLPDHRPERAWRFCPPGEASGDTRPLPRPLWLLREPAPLQVHDGFPCLNGRLVIARGPERIESGWWDGADVTRDYYIAEDVRHARLWIFRERRPPRRWFLHGVFA